MPTNKAIEIRFRILKNELLAVSCKNLSKGNELI